MTDETVTITELENARTAATFVTRASDELHLRAVAQLVKLTWPTAATWAREFQPYDDMPGNGDWSLVEVRDGMGVPIEHEAPVWDDAVQHIQDLLDSLYEFGEYDQRNEHRLP